MFCPAIDGKDVKRTTAPLRVALQQGVGGQVLMFAWHGSQFCLDEVRHAIRVTGPETAKPFVLGLLQAR